MDLSTLIARAREAGLVELTIDAAEQGDAYAQAALGWHYETGEGVEKDPAEAVAWYRKAAEQGDAYAQTNLGNCYHKGEGVEKDLVEAVAWFRKAAEQGYATAQFNLAFCEFNGVGVEKDLLAAVAWLRKAAEQGHARAQTDLAVCEMNGVAIKKDLFPWEDVEVCLRKQRQSKKIDTSTKCPECGNPVTVILFTSPPWTWENLCGREGYLTICDECRAQLGFQQTVMN